jgi:hypothetical protein
LNSEGDFVTEQGGREYVGPPTPAVDEAWDTLLRGLSQQLGVGNKNSYSSLGLNLDFDKDEVDLAGSTFQWPESGHYFSGLDVYHSLHCLVYTVFNLIILKKIAANSFY